METTKFKNTFDIPKDFTGIAELDNPKTNSMFNGRIEILVNGMLHCADKPALTFPNGQQFWYIAGKITIPECIKMLRRIKREI